MSQAILKFVLAHRAVHLQAVFGGPPALRYPRTFGQRRGADNALYQKGQKDEARGLLEEAIRSYDWNEVNATSCEAWIAHILRREAEAEIITKQATNEEGCWVKRPHFFVPGRSKSRVRCTAN